MRRLAILVIALAAPGCGLFFSLDGYEGSATDAAAVDAPPYDASAEATGMDASADAQTRPDAADADADATVPTDADAKTSTDASWCSQQTFEAGVWFECFDFDESDAGLVDPQLVGATMSVERDGAAASSPGDLVVEVPALGPYPDTATGEELLASGVAAGTATFAFDVRTNPSNASMLGRLGWTGSGAYGYVTYGVQVAAGGLVALRVQADYADGGGYDDTNFDAGVALDSQWHRFELTVAASGDVTLQFDGAEVVDASSPYGYVQSADYRCGVDYIGGPTSLEDFHFDNVVLEAVP